MTINAVLPAAGNESAVFVKAALNKLVDSCDKPRLADSHYKLRVERIGYQMYYGGGGAYLYQPIPKCAYTTIKTLLLVLEGLPVDSNAWRRHQKEFNGFPGTHHLTIQEQLDIFEGRTNTFKFTVVRNPYARLSSAYRDKIQLNRASYLEKSGSRRLNRESYYPTLSPSKNSSL